MSIKGFSTEFKDPIHYILDITDQIWKERGIHLIHDYYAENCPTRTPHDVVVGPEKVVAGTAQTLHEWPDRDLLGEDVIIGDKSSGFYSSHRVRSTCTHAREGMFGPATGKTVTMLTIADCLCRDNQVVEEWLVRDHSRIAHQLGINPETFGRAMGARKPDNYTIGNAAMRQRWSDPDGLTIEGDKTIGNTVLDLQDAIWNQKKYSVITTEYDPAVHFEGPGGVICFGHETTRNIYNGILAAIPEGKYEPHHIIVRKDPGDRVRVAIRWSYLGTHTGLGCYGAPTGSEIALLGISHFELRNNKILFDYMLMDEVAVFAQLEASAQ